MSKTFLQVAQELGMTEYELKQIPPPRIIGRKFNREIIYKMLKADFQFLEKVAVFPSNMTTVKDKCLTLISYVEHYPKFQGCTFNEIWFRFAHEYYLNGKQKIFITKFPFMKKNGR